MGTPVIKTIANEYNMPVCIIENQQFDGSIAHTHVIRSILKTSREDHHQVVNGLQAVGTRQRSVQAYSN
jgi:hypothetical protein